MLLSATGKLLTLFHKDCPEHGVAVSWADMHRVERKRWITKAEAIAYRDKEGTKILARSPDGEQAHIMWVEWLNEEDYQAEFFPKEVLKTLESEPDKSSTQTE